MVTKENNKMMLLILLSMVSMIAGEDQQEQVGQMIASIMGIFPSQATGNCATSDGDGKYLHGIRGLADYLGVSVPTAQKYKDSGILDGAIQRVGRQFNFDMNKVDEVFSNAK